MNSGTYKFKSVSLRLIPHDEIVNSAVCQVYRHDDGQGPLGKFNTLSDPNMGSLTKEPCIKCGGDVMTCSGHRGYIKLSDYFMNPEFTYHVFTILKCVCSHCSRLLVDKNSDQFKKILKKPIDYRIKYIISFITFGI